MSETKNTTPFSQQLAYINKGTLDAELTEALAEVIKAVRETGKKGAVTLTLNCAMLNTRDENTMKVTPKVSRLNVARHIIAFRIRAGVLQK